MADTEIQNALVPTSRSDAMLLLEAGYLWMDMGKFDKAREIFAGAAQLMPKSEVPQLALGTLEFAQGHHEKALQAYRAAQKIAPKSGLPRAHAGEVLMFMNKASEAVKELKAAKEVEPKGDGAKLAQALMDAHEAGALPPPTKAAKKK